MNTTLCQNRTEEPHDYWIYYVNIDLRHQYGISVLSRRRSSARNVHSGEERGETDVFAGYKAHFEANFKICIDNVHTFHKHCSGSIN